MYRSEDIEELNEEELQIVAEFCRAIQGEDTESKSIAASTISTSAPCSLPEWQACNASDGESDRCKTPSPRWQLMPDTERELSQIWQSMWIGCSEVYGSCGDQSNVKGTFGENVEEKAVPSLVDCEAQPEDVGSGNSPPKGGYAPGQWLATGESELERQDAGLQQQCEMATESELGSELESVQLQLEPMVKHRNRKRGKGRKKLSSVCACCNDAGQDDRIESEKPIDETSPMQVGSDAGQNDRSVNESAACQNVVQPSNQCALDFAYEAELFEHWCERHQERKLSSSQFASALERFQCSVATIRDSLVPTANDDRRNRRLLSSYQMMS